jgi:DNA-binding transcriptional LysR family regulator
MSIRLRDLENFLESTSCATFGQSAKKLGISQPALSESIKRLESDIGGRLFYRSKNGISLTPTGRKAAEHAKSVFVLLSEIQPNRKDAGKYQMPTVTIGCHPVIGSYVLPMAMRRLPSSNRIHIVHANSREIQSEVQNGLVDLGIVVNPISNPDLIIKHVANDIVCAWSSSGSNATQIICDPELFQTQAILRGWKKRPTQILPSNSLELIARLTNAGVGYGIIPTRTVKMLKLRLNKVVEAPEQQDEIAIIYRPEFGKTEQEKRIIESIKSSFSE